MAPKYRTLWLSDIHLGTSASRANDLLDFLDDVSAEKIYLNGDIIDLERMKTRATFSDAHRNVIVRILQLAQAGIEIVYIPGNHDIQFREIIGREIFGIPVQLEASHKTEDGRTLLVTHGDLLDRAIRKGTTLGQFGARAYGMLVSLNVIVNQLGNRFGQEYLPVSAHIKKRLAAANDYIDRFERMAAIHARDRGFDGIVCGHIHRPCIREIMGICYANDGDWVEHRTALAETETGQLAILQWRRDEIVVDSLADVSPRAA